MPKEGGGEKKAWKGSIASTGAFRGKTSRDEKW